MPLSTPTMGRARAKCFLGVHLIIDLCFGHIMCGLTRPDQNTY